ncbi:MAG: WbuC family cupin fold metalloprotein [Balneolia bacterium]|nr:WbuC family cupin fold metalloprotein [Balneolia bacterium]
MSKLNASPGKPLALENFSGDLFVMDDALIAHGCQAARESARKRIIFPVQRSQDDAVQRLINFLQPGTYIRPHQHPGHHATETILVHKGRIGFMLFRDDGSVSDAITLSANSATCMADMVPGLWHSFVVLEPDTVIIEFKKGPYDPETDKNFAKWAPEEGSPAAAAYLQKLTHEF